ncbi:MAG: hypothetical protein WDO15_10905 [Bacteroidota bacterium]
MYLIFIALFGWAIFYFEDINKLGYFIKVLFGGSNNDGWSLSLSESFERTYVLVGAGVDILYAPYITGSMRRWKKRLSPKTHFWILASLAFIVLFLVSVTLLVGKTYNHFYTSGSRKA